MNARISGPIGLMVFVLMGAVLAYVPQLKAAGDSEKLEAVKKMFTSPYSEEEYYRTDQLLTTATGSQVPVHKAPSTASVITAEDIEKMGAVTLDQILATVPGLHVYPSGFNIFTSVWSIRGLNAGTNPQVLLLINGLPMTSSYDGGRPKDFKMPVAMISRIEVVRGPGSAVYGADAFSGVINVITKDNFEIDGTKVGARYGSFDTVDTWLQHGGQYMGWDIWGGIEVQKTDGDHGRIITKDYMNAIGRSVFANTPGYLDTHYTVTTMQLGLRKDNITFQLYGSWLDSAMGPGGLQVVTYGNDIKNTDMMADLTWRDKKFTADWDLSLRLYSIYKKEDIFYQYFPAGYLNMLGNPIHTDNDSGLEATAFYTGFNAHKLRLSLGGAYSSINTDQYKNFGLGITRQFGPMVNISNTPYVYMKDQSRNLWFASVQDEWHITKALALTGGVRLDEYSDFGSTINPRAALVWESTYYLTTKLLYGRAFRAPSFGELYTQNNPVVNGNPNLHPETIDTYELAFDLQPSKSLHTVVGFFAYHAQDLIQVVGGSPSISENVGEQKGKGFEIEAEWQVTPALKLRSNFAYQRSENATTDSPIPETPEMELYLNPHWDFAKDWSLDGQYFWIGKQHRAQGDPRKDIDAYDLVNLTLRRKNIIGHLDGALAVRNLFDSDGRIPSPYNASAPGGSYIPGDYPIEGRSVWVELSYKF